MACTHTYVYIINVMMMMTMIIMMMITAITKNSNIKWRHFLKIKMGDTY